MACCNCGCGLLLDSGVPMPEFGTEATCCRADQSCCCAWSTFTSCAASSLVLASLSPPAAPLLAALAALRGLGWVACPMTVGGGVSSAFEYGVRAPALRSDTVRSVLCELDRGKLCSNSLPKATGLTMGLDGSRWLVAVLEERLLGADWT